MQSNRGHYRYIPTSIIIPIIISGADTVGYLFAGVKQCHVASQWESK